MPIGFRSSVLLIHPRLAAGEALAQDLKDCGFATDIVPSVATARALGRARYYRTVVLVADLWRGTGMAQLAQLRAARPRTWIVLASSNPPPDELTESLRYLADAVLIGPLSSEELARRLVAFSMRPRPL